MIALRLIVTLMVAALCGYFLVNNNTMGFLATIAIGLIMIRVSEKISRDIAYDERDKFIATLASYTTLLVVMVSIALLTIAYALGDVLGIDWLYNVTKDIVEKYAPFMLYIMVVYIASWIVFKLKYS